MNVQQDGKMSTALTVSPSKAIQTMMAAHPAIFHTLPRSTTVQSTAGGKGQGNTERVALEKSALQEGKSNTEGKMYIPSIPDAVEYKYRYDWTSALNFKRPNFIFPRRRRPREQVEVSYLMRMERW